jgi:hypothetical protein
VEQPAADVHVIVAEPLLHGVAEALGTVRVGDDGWCLLSDDDEQEPHILLVPPLPVACADALRRFAAGHPSSLVPSDRLVELPAAVAATAAGGWYVSGSVVAAAKGVPPLDTPARQLLLALLSEPTIDAVARRVGISRATVKRRTCDLVRCFAARNRTELVRRAVELGYASAGRRPASGCVYAALPRRSGLVHGVEELAVNFGADDPPMRRSRSRCDTHLRSMWT